MSSVILQIRPVDEQFAQRFGAIGGHHAEDGLHRPQIGHHMARRADAAHSRGHVGRLPKAPMRHHGLEQTRWLHHRELAASDLAAFDAQVDISVTLYASHVIDVDSGPRHSALLLSLPVRCSPWHHRHG